MGKYKQKKQDDWVIIDSTQQIMAEAEQQAAGKVLCRNQALRKECALY